MSRVGAAIVVVVTAGCSGTTPALPPEPATAPPGDARSDVMLLPPPTSGAAEPARPLPQRPGRPIEIILRSVPLGADVAIDGTPYGVTPQVWSGETGGEHEFTFTMRGFSMARYRFIPITAGILHARLEPLVGEPAPGAVVPPGMLPPPPVPGTRGSFDAAPPPLAAPDAYVPDAPPPGLGPQP